MKNNNGQIISRLAKSALVKNKRKTLTMFFAVLLSAFLLFSVLTVGVTYFKMQRIQNIRMNGAEFDAIMYGVTEEQQEFCDENEDILRTGICAVSGYVEATDKDNTPNVGLMWADPTFWDTMMEPARTSVEGEYPKQENEIMVTEKALEECGYGNLDIGDTFRMTVGTPKGSFEKEFRISGKWSGYGEKKIFYVSQSFYEASGYQVSDVASGRFYMDIRQKLMTEKEQNALIEDMNLGKQQRMFFSEDMSFSISIVTGMIGLAAMICLCAYLLIYNIMYLSVAGNTRYYGLLQTIGMTERQIYSMIYRQMAVIGGGGAACGILLACAVSFFLIPFVVESLGIRTGQAGQVQISFHPLIFALTILIVGITVMAAGRKPAKIAAGCSPLEAIGYRPQKNRSYSGKTGRGKVLWRLAKKQITKEKKKTGIVMVSLASGLSIFLCLVTLFSSQGAREYTSNSMDLDLVVQNDTIRKETQEERKAVLDDSALENMKQTQGVKNVHPVFFAEIIVPWEPEFSDMWMKEFYEMWMTIPYEDEKKEYQEHPENFGTSMIGIDQAAFENLNQALAEPVDEEAFMRGDTCILYRDGLDFTSSDVEGKEVTCAEYSNPEHTKTFSIAGLTDDNYYTALVGYPPTIIVSEQALKEFAAEPMLFKMGIYYEETYDQETEDRILGELEGLSGYRDLSMESKIDLMETIREAQGNMMLVGTGLVFILALIGIMNYINTSISSVQNRLVELSVLESIGMTDRQMKWMLLLEGLLYAAGSLLITMTAGLAVTYGTFQSMNYRGAPFAVPVLPLVCGIAVVFLICMTAPFIAWKKMVKQHSLIERIRGFE